MLNKKNERGATMVEYALVTALVAVLSVVGFTRLGSSEVDAITSSGDALAETTRAMENDRGEVRTFQEIMEEVGHPLASGGCGGGGIDGCGGGNGGPGH